LGGEAVSGIGHHENKGKFGSALKARSSFTVAVRGILKRD